jgi:hypothetical protein
VTESARSSRTDGLRAPEETTAAPPSRSHPSIPLTLPSRIGNRAFTQFARTLARDVDTSVPVHSVPVLLVGAAPRVHASQRATPGNARLAAEIDEVDTLSDRELRKQHEAEALAISDPASRDADHERRLEAIEYVERWRRIGGPARVEAANANWTHAEQGRNLRARLERGIAHFGTFSEAWLNLRYPAADFAGTANHAPHQDEDLDQIWKEAEQFYREFKRQAAVTAERMLKQSHDAIITLLKGYGVDAGTADDAGYMMARHYRDVDEQLPRVLEATKSNATVDSVAARHMRWNLAQNAKWIREQQSVVAAAEDKSGKDALKVPLNRDSGPEWDTVRADQKALGKAKRELEERWILAEGVNPLLAAYRRGSAIETADLSKLDTGDPDAEVSEILATALPTLRDIRKAQDLVLGPHPDKSPLTLPAVVAATRSAMFIPGGSIRDGIARDVVAAAVEAEAPSWLLRISELMLAAVTITATGGTALVAYGAAAGIAVYEAQREWSKYSTDKVLSDTDLDLARSLSQLEPSLTSFAVALIAAGFAAVPALGLFRKAIQAKKLLEAGEDAGRLVGELNAAKPGLGDEALSDIRAGEAPEGSPGRDPGGDGHPESKPPHEPENPKEPNEPGKGEAGGAGAAGARPTYTFNDESSLRQAIKQRFRGFSSGKPYNRKWLKARELVGKGGSNLTADDLQLLETAIAAMRNEQELENTAVRIWQMARAKNHTCAEAVLELAGDDIEVVHGGLLSQERFRPHIQGEHPIYDLAEQSTDHGAWAHLFQEAHLTRMLGPQRGAMVRRLIANAEGASALEGSTERQLWSWLWDGLYDAEPGEINSPEALAHVLHPTLDLPGALGKGG